MYNTAISVEKLSKLYLINHDSTGKSERYSTLRDAIAHEVASLRRRVTKIHPRSRLQRDDVIEKFWALTDLSFEIRHGERVGIIGRNGAGKSTLLKLLSRITEPTRGRITLQGRVASLLEVGTGFHPELTGKENIYLNGAILGMRRSEIDSMYSNILDFAEVSRFIDTPVKRYSSGMYMRLAFSVAAHLKPEILLVDEVLAVGDSEFQKKCLGKLEELGNDGTRTVVFVSHQMQAIEALCDRVLILNNGRLEFDGGTHEGISNYGRLVGHKQSPKVDLRNARRAGGIQKAICEAWIENKNGELAHEIAMGEEIYIFFRFDAEYMLTNPGFGMSIDTMLGSRIATYGNQIEQIDQVPPMRTGIASFHIKNNIFMPGRYLINFGLSERFYDSIDYIKGALELVILPTDFFRTGRAYEQSHGNVRLDVSFNVSDI